MGSGTGGGISGASSTSGAVGATGTVLPGTYTLTEVPNDNGSVTGAYAFGDWSCDSGKVPNASRQISVANGENVTCTVTNTPVPPFHIVKNATTPIAGNTHVGTTVAADANGSVVMNYTITVTNDGTFVGNTGAVTESFQVPAGLVWDGAKTATVTYLPGATGATAAGFTPAKTWTEAELRASTTLANSIQKLPAGQSVSFTISIPLKLDTTIAAGQTQSNYELNATVLGQCNNLTSPGGNKYSDTIYGVANVAGIVEENQGYTDIPTQDNLACIPVSAPTTWKVQKSAPATYGTGGAPATWAPAGTTGAQVAVQADGTVTISYQAVVTNSGNFSGLAPAITDQLTLPGGFTITDVQLGNAVPPAAGVSQGTTGAFTIPAATATLAPNASTTYYVTVKARAASLAAVDWTKAGTCNTTAGGTASAGGFFNAVTLTGDTDGVDNNDACVPVTRPTTPIQVQKWGSNCDVGQPTCKLVGAAYDLYAVDPSTVGATPITPGFTTVDGSLFTSGQLAFPGPYWLVETKAPSGFSPLATPVRFTLASTGITVTGGGSTDITVSGTGNLTLNIKDPVIGALPEAGGRGPIPYAVFGLLLTLAGALHHHRNSRSGGRRAAI